MKNSKKRGFTIVELVIVIAVIAILAGVLIPTFTSIIKKANEASDTALIKSLNTSLKADEVLTSKPATMYDALQVVKNDGYDLTKIKATASGNEILWDSVNNCFVYLKDNQVTYIPDSYDVAQSGVALWKIVAASEELSATYSNYLADGRTGSVDAKTGVDVGENTGIDEIKYTGSATAQTVVIRTKGGKLTIDAGSDSVDYYGTISSVVVENIATSSFHVHGVIIDTLQVKKGHVVLESTAVVSKLVSESVVTVEAKTDAVLIDNTGVANEAAKANTATAISNAAKVPHLNIGNSDELMSALGYTKAGDKNYYSQENIEYKDLIRLKSDVEIDISDIKINNNALDCDKGVIVVVNSSIDMNGGKITTANMNFYIRKDNAVISNGTFQAGANSAKATKINSYALGIEADNVTLKNLTINGGVSVGFELSGNNAVLENCTVKSGDWHAVCAQHGSSVTIKGGTYSRMPIVSGNYSSEVLFQAAGKVGDFGNMGDINRIDFVNVVSEVATPFAPGVTTATISDKICNGYVVAKIGG